MTNRLPNISLKFADDISLNMVYCPPGTFKMGAFPNDELAESLEKPRHSVTLAKGFWIAETPMTRRMYTAIYSDSTSTHLYEASLDSPASQHTWEESVQLCELLNSQLSELTPHPIDNIPLEKLEINLPTEAQWEYTCRAGTTTNWHFGDDMEILEEYAWYGKHPSVKLPPVKQKKPNPWGIYDLYGMVYEWCLNDFLPYRGKDGQDYTIIAE